MTKTDLIFPAFSLIFLDIAVKFCFRCKFSFQEMPFESSLTVAWTNHNSLLRMKTDYAKWLFTCSPKWAKTGYREMMKEFETKVM